MMNWADFKQHFKDTWDFHRQNPPLLLLWGVYLVSVIYAFAGS